MNELDFFNFGIEPNNPRLLHKICDALSGIYAAGNLKLWATLLHQGSISIAAKFLNVSIPDFRAEINPKKRLPLDLVDVLMQGTVSAPRFRASKFDSQHIYWGTEALLNVNQPTDWGIILIGAEMLLEMSDKDRMELLRPTAPPITKDRFVQMVLEWEELPSRLIVAKSKGVLECY